MAGFSAATSSSSAMWWKSAPAPSVCLLRHPAAARTHFGIERFATLYDRIEEMPAEEWAEKCPAPAPAAPAPAPDSSPRAKPAAPAYFRIVLARLRPIGSANPRNLALLLGQPVLIGLLVAWMADTVSFKLFLAWLPRVDAKLAGDFANRFTPLHRLKSDAGLKCGFVPLPFLFHLMVVRCVVFEDASHRHFIA